MPVETLREMVANLRSLIPQLPTSSQEFARGLCDQYDRRGYLSPRQEPWVPRLITRAQQAANPEASQLLTQVATSLNGITQLFNRASQHLRRPAIVLGVPLANRTVRLSIAGPSSRNPGSLYVTDYTDYDVEGLATGRRMYYGRVGTDGVWYPRASQFEELPEGTEERIVERLRDFAARPAEVAAEHGRLTGRCCFCNRGLEDERSTAVGYGPICAGHFGLPWGDRPAQPFLTVPQRTSESLWNDVPENITEYDAPQEPAETEGEARRRIERQLQMERDQAELYRTAGLPSDPPAIEMQDPVETQPRSTRRKIGDMPLNWNKPTGGQS